MERHLEEFVVLGVAAGLDGRGDDHPLGDAVQHPDECLPILQADVRVEFRPREDVRELLERRFGLQELILIHRLAHGLGGHGLRQQQAADEKIGISDDALGLVGHRRRRAAA